MTPLKSLFDLWSNIAYTFPETKTQSLIKASRLYQTHGSEFLTNYLPQIGKWLDQCLNSGRLLPLSGIKTLKDGRPVLLQEFFVTFFVDGYVNSDLDPESLGRVRTLLFMFYKLEQDFTPEQVIEAEKKFVTIDNSVKTEFSLLDIARIRATFNSLLPTNPMDIRGRHSNGATADRVDNIGKRTIWRHIPSLCKVYGPVYSFNSLTHFKWYKEHNKIITCEPSSRVAFVPKDSRGPRTICMEPHERMFLQQGLMHSIYEHVENYSLARGRVNFTNQDVNRTLAYLSSMDRSYATLDLKDASDLVSWELIYRISSDVYKECFTALRTPTATLPSGDVVQLKKFAPMGSALCFPVEAILFYSIATLITDDVYVYGDDIIVPLEHATDVVAKLEHYGLKVNVDKSCIQGYFRESCGFDAFKGHNITPVRYRRNDYISVVAFANNIRDKHGIEAGLAVIRWYESINHIIVPRLPISLSSTGAIAFYSDMYDNSIMYRRRWNKNLHRHEIRILSTTISRRKYADDDYGLVFDYLTVTHEHNQPHEDDMYCTPRRVSKLPEDIRDRITILKNKIGYEWVPI